MTQNITFPASSTLSEENFILTNNFQNIDIILLSILLLIITYYYILTNKFINHAKI